jgi:hydroxymethylbilane synthase
MKDAVKTRKILLMGGTTEGRELYGTGLPFVYSAATEYGAGFVGRGHEAGEVLSGRMDESRIIELLRSDDFAGVVDATHPYATEVKQNIQRACDATGTPLFRVLRARTDTTPERDIVIVGSWDEAARYLERTDGNVLLTVGSNALRNLTSVPGYRSRFFARVLPAPESVAVCEELGLQPANIIAELGPFSESANLAHLVRTQARILVTKDGGREGGVPEKIAAARKHGARVLMIARPDTGESNARIESGTAMDAWSWALSLPGIERNHGRPRAVKRRTVRVGSRESVLAIAQARAVMDSIASVNPEIDLELVTMKTQGDRFSASFPSSNPLAERRVVKGLFVKELESALLSGTIDLAVHSLKDMSLDANPELPIVACSPREDPRDVAVIRAGARGVPGASARPAALLGSDYSGLSRLAAGCSSPRRRVQLRRVVGCETRPVRGNVITRLERLDSGDWGFDFLVLAAAGLIRLGMRARIDCFFPADAIIPAAGQGVLACQGRAGEDYEYLLAAHDPVTDACVTAERAFASYTGGGCSSPVASYAVADGGEILLRGLYVDEERGIYLSDRLSGPITDARALGERLAERVISRAESGDLEDV